MIINVNKLFQPVKSVINDIKKEKAFVKHTYNLNETNTFDLCDSSSVKSFLATRQEGAFGIECQLNMLGRKMLFFTDHLSKANLPPSRPIYLDPTRSDMSCHYLVFQKYNYLPFSFTSCEDVWNLVQKYLQSHLKKGMRVYIQTLFQYSKNEQWKAVAYDKYNGYLDGIENLSDNKYLRGLQYKLLDLPLKPRHTPNPVDEVIEKIEQNGYSVCVRLMIEGGVSSKLVDKVLLAFNSQRYMNGWKAIEAGDKQKFINDTQTRTLPSRFKNQILCPSEMTVFFGGGEINKDDLNLKPVSKMLQEQKPELTKPKPKEELILDPDSQEVVDDLTAAMKKLKFTKDEELKIVDFKKSLTLNMISFERPADLPIDKLRKRAEDIEIEMHIEGISFDHGTKKGSIAFMYPRRDRQIVSFQEMVSDKDIRKLIDKQELPIIVGVDLYGNPLIYDLTKLVHVLIAGGTGMGKSVFENVLLLGLTYNVSPDELRLYLIDPKLVELSDYENFPHVEKIITDCKKAATTLNKIVKEMDERYQTLKDAGVKDIQQYNQKYPNDKMPYIVVVIDEFADLMMIDDTVEQFVQRLGQKARGCGIHLIICTQRPSVDVITGVIKANMMTRIGFTCESHHDYKTIFDYMIPYRLLGKGDGVMKWHGNDSQFVRFQSPMNMDGGIFEDIIKKWGGKVKTIVEEDEEDTDDEIDDEDVEPVFDDKYMLLKKVICETGETRMTQLRKLTSLNQNKLQEYLHQLIEEDWLEKGSTKQSGTKLLLTDDERAEFLDLYEELYGEDGKDYH